jgi:predicted O-methyltransferase YrrM
MNASDYCRDIDDSHPMTTWKGHILQLASIAAHGCKNILELGSHRGFSTAAMALAAPGARVVAVDLCDTVPQETRVAYWKNFGIRNIFPVWDDAAAYLARCKRAGETFDLVFHDAVHGDAAAAEYVACAEIADILAIHDWEQLSQPHQDDLINRFARWTSTADAKGRHLFVGWKQ